MTRRPQTSYVYDRSWRESSIGLCGRFLTSEDEGFHRTICSILEGTIKFALEWPGFYNSVKQTESHICSLTCVGYIDFEHEQIAAHHSGSSHGVPLLYLPCSRQNIEKSEKSRLEYNLEGECDDSKHVLWRKLCWLPRISVIPTELLCSPILVIYGSLEHSIIASFISAEKSILIYMSYQ